MIIGLSRLDPEPGKPFKIYFCTSLPFEQMIDEIDTIDMKSLIDMDGVASTVDAEPFMLEHIYLN